MKHRLPFFLHSSCTCTLNVYNEGMETNTTTETNKHNYRITRAGTLHKACCGISARTGLLTTTKTAKAHVGPTCDHCFFEKDEWFDAPASIVKMARSMKANELSRFHAERSAEIAANNKAAADANTAKHLNAPLDVIEAVREFHTNEGPETWRAMKDICGDEFDWTMIARLHNIEEV
jgi:hypothetical protein